MSSHHERSTIMVVDDIPENVKLLENMLKGCHYRVLAFTRGDLAVEAAAKSPPDLILLDVMMPEMDGFEVCKLLKEEDALKDVPVIFISALDQTHDKVKGFSVGGVDYISKPFHLQEVKARISTHLELRRQRRELERAYERLKELESLRDRLVHMIVHDMRSPLTSIMGYMDLARISCSDPKVKESIEQALMGARTLREMIQSILDVSRMEEGGVQLDYCPVDVIKLIMEVRREFEPLLDRRRWTLRSPEEIGTVVCDGGLIKRVIQNLVSNAIKFTRGDGGFIEVEVIPIEDSVRIQVSDNGPGVPDEYRDRVFEKFFQVEAHKRGEKYSAGLGLNFCKLAVEAHGGRIGVDGEVGKGSTFWFELPINQIVAKESTPRG